MTSNRKCGSQYECSTMSWLQHMAQGCLMRRQLHFQIGTYLQGEGASLVSLAFCPECCTVGIVAQDISQNRRRGSNCCSQRLIAFLHGVVALIRQSEDEPMMSRGASVAIPVSGFVALRKRDVVASWRRLCHHVSKDVGIRTFPGAVS